MKLQIAVDIADSKKIMEIAGQISDIIDIFEVGTPAIMKEGMLPVKMLKEAYPDMTVLADSKIVDGGAIECRDICECGADIVTVLALSDNATVKEVVKTAHQYGRKVLADLLCVTDIPKRSVELIDMDVDYIGVHTGVDMQKQGHTPLEDLRELVRAVGPERAAVAGGVTLQTLPDYTTENPEIIIAGSALYKANDVRAAVLQMKEVLNS